MKDRRYDTETLEGSDTISSNYKPVICQKKLSVLPCSHDPSYIVSLFPLYCLSDPLEWGDTNECITIFHSIEISLSNPLEWGDTNQYFPV